MRQTTQCGLVLAAVTGALLATAPASAHHSFAMFDRTRTLTITGTVKKFDWVNPHAYIWVEVPKKGGDAQVWGVESASPGLLVRHGWRRDTLKPGDKVTLDINPLKDGRPGGAFIRLHLPDGTTLTTGAGALQPTDAKATN